MNTENKPIDRAIALAGGQSALAKWLGVSQAMVHKWKSGASITPERAKQIEMATDGAVRRHELRPDIFDAPSVVAGVSMTAVCDTAPAASPCTNEGEACNAS
jgi:DNA-binding transcriptional regulator YdaS (Cro superfamily)